MSFHGQGSRANIQRSTLIFGQGKESAVTTVQSKGFSRDPCLHRMEKTMKHETIRDKFHRGDFKVPCSRLEFRSFDEELNTAVQDSPGRR